MEKKPSSSRLFLIDGNSLLYRAFYALPDTMKTATGITTNAIYGFINMLLKLLDEHPDHIAVAFDRPAPTFRHKEYKEYKATRQKAPDTLKEQMPIIRELISKFSIPVYEIDGYEADDIIGTIAKKAESEGLKVTIVTGDKDTLQLVSGRISVMIAVKGITDTVIYDPARVIERFGIPAASMIDYKALAGDPSDNIPGIPGVGDKTAVTLIKRFGDLEGIISHADEIEGKLKDKVKNNIEIARLSKKLVTLVTDVPIKFDIREMEYHPIDWGRVLPMFEKLEFRSLVKKYGAPQGLELFAQASIEKVHHQEANTDYKVINDEASALGLINSLKKSGRFAFDTETTSLSPFEADLAGISFSFSANTGFYVPKDVFMKAGTIERFRDVMGDDSTKKIGHNIKYDIEVLRKFGIEVAGVISDTMLAAYILDPTAGKFNLKYLGAKYFGRQMTTYEELMLAEGTGDIKDAKLEDVANYACADADITCQLADALGKELKEKELEYIFNEIEVPLIEVLAAIEENGVSIDEKKLSSLSEDLTKRLSRLETEIHCIAGEQFNINSTKQLAVILFDKLKLPKGKRTKTGASTDASVLEALAPDFEIARKLLEYRQFTKLKNTYIDVLPELVNKRTGRIHTSFNQIITATGRLSSSNPNLQNIPIRSEIGRQIREAFIPANKDDVIISADYSQIELRILAHLSQDPELIKDFKEDRDIHSATAADVFGVPFESVTKEMRSFSKAINFGIVYGMSAFGLAKQLNIKKQEAEEYIAKYFNKYRGVKAFMDSTIESARKLGYVTTLLGRRRYLRDINSYNQNERQAEERVAINTPVQGTAADIIKVAMIKIHHKLKDVGARHGESTPSIKMILQIHDELVFECPKSEEEALKKMIVETMSTAVPLDVPVKVDIGSGKSWGEAKE